LTETGWITIATLVIGFLNSAIMVWLKVKQSESSDKVDRVVQINEKQDDKLNVIHADINGRVDQLIDSKVHQQIAMAVALAVADALKKERDAEAERPKEIAESVIATAKEQAEALLAKAEQDAEALLAKAKSEKP